MTNPVEQAVAPLKAEAVERAKLEAEKYLDRVKADLAANNDDRNAAAPYPWNRDGRMTNLEEGEARTKYDMYCKLTKSREYSGKFNAPVYVDMNPVMVERFREETVLNAEAQYDAFVAKLVSKVGEAVDATLNGSHVWGYSILTVTAPDNTVTRWKTQQIVNMSKLGKLFNQWPTRKQK